ncbi:NAD-dependent SIR2 family protein deacetylase [Catenuloplanes atrovinosus]|uniref:NAD-dependent protein deacetylase n=1 Tax=Catenuloplanes atrovinosus TaxID=137266 RepID=A0AAE3YMP7_9ACTN|nr:NAD-dependent protein deacetylase [Catenuloplanes atrovinosus]MDR7274641.1 NAD-dependent SIR2 family protein deacetylase [Catenuloplanes atrovinosus]
MEDGISRLSALVADGDVVVLSGAGLSTESGIPDYRGPSGVARARAPMTYQAFTREPDARRRYWARSHVGWRTIARAAPNAGHAAVAALEQAGLLTGIITQNVDGLHQAAGAKRVVELHGGLDRVICLDCGEVGPREALDARLAAANPAFTAEAIEIKPDGDVEIDEELEAGFRVPPCESCGDGLLKPDVVFFGETVPRERVQECFALVESARSLLVLGSSLTVMSGRRFVLRAAKRGIPVAIVNRGVTRGDAYAQLRLDAPLGSTLSTLARQFQP